MSNKKRINIQEILSGNIFTHDFFRKQYKLFLLIAALLFIYIYNGFECQKQARQMARLEQQIKDAHYELLDLSAEYTEMTRPSTLNRLLKERNSQVRESTIPPTLISE